MEIFTTHFRWYKKLKEKCNVLTVPKFFPVDKTGKALSDRGIEDLLEYGVDICENGMKMLESAKILFGKNPLVL